MSAHTIALFNGGKARSFPNPLRRGDGSCGICPAVSLVSSFESSDKTRRGTVLSWIIAG